MAGTVMKKNASNGERGFTLVELILVIILILMLALIAFPKFLGALQLMRLNLAAQKMAQDIRYARETAIGRHDIYGVEFKESSNAYELFSWDGTAKALMTDPHKNVSLVVDYDLLPEFSGVHIASVGNICSDVSQCQTAELRIDRFGRPHDRLMVPLTSPVTVTLQNGSFTRTVQVTPETAFTQLS
jgi:prepilin-type N-terminal cleavage/methylation domain-containing protein